MKGKKNKQYRGKHNNNRGKSSPDKRMDDRDNDSRGYRRRNIRDDKSVDDRLTPLNDFKWYNANPMLTEAAARVAFPYRPGMYLNLNDQSNGTRLGRLPIPGVFAMNWVPTIGYSNSATDPASIAAKEIFAKVRESFSGSIDADPPDFVIYFMALDSVFSYIGMLKRVYRILNTYTPENYLIPDLLLNALSVPTAVANELRANKAQLWQVINQ